MFIESNQRGQMALRSSGYGPILAMPDDLSLPLDFNKERELRAALQVACEALARNQVAGGPLPPAGGDFERLETAICEVGERARAWLVELPNDNQRLYDQVFEVSRTADAAAGLVHGLLVATRALLRQLGKANGLFPSLRKGLTEGLASSICALDPSLRFAPRFTPMPSLPDLPPYDPLDRWVEGHHVLFALCQSAEHFFYQLARFEAEGHDQAARAMLLASADAFDAIGHSFALAGDFTPDEYNPGITDRMIAADKNFSGLWFADHAKAKVLAKHTLKGCPMRLGGDAVAKFVLAFNYASSSHVYVCSEKTDAEAPSLLQAGSAAPVPGPESLRQVSLQNMRRIKANLE